MLMEMAAQSTDDGLVMQLHAGSLRNHNQSLFERFGPDRGADIPVATEYTRNLRPLLNAFGNDTRFRLMLFTLDESTYSRELAPLAGHYPAVRLGPAWWFHDSIEGMTRYRDRVTETAGIYNTAGFNDDTRAFCSIPARHDLSRRVDANWLARLVARHVVSIETRKRWRARSHTISRRRRIGYDDRSPFRRSAFPVPRSTFPDLQTLRSGSACRRLPKIRRNPATWNVEPGTWNDRPPDCPLIPHIHAEQAAEIVRPRGRSGTDARPNPAGVGGERAQIVRAAGHDGPL